MKMKKNSNKKVSEKEIDAFLGKDTEFVGQLVFNGGVRLDGKFSGEIYSSGNLIIGETAIIDAEIKVDSITISGSINGNIEAKNRIELYPPAKLSGNIRSPVLVIKEGVFFHGNCQMEPEERGKSKIVPMEDGITEKKEKKANI